MPSKEKRPLSLQERYEAHLSRAENSRLNGKSVPRRTFEGWVRQLKAASLRHTEARKSPEFLKKEAFVQRRRYWSDPEKYISIVRRSQERNKDGRRRVRRLRRKANPALAREYDNKYRSRTIKAFGTKLRRGEISLDEYSRRLRKALTRIDAEVRDNEIRTRQAGLRDWKNGSGVGEN